MKKFSYGFFAVAVLGTGMLFLVVSGLLILAFTPGPQVGLLIALAGIVGAIGGMGFVANRLLDRINEDPETDKQSNNG